MLLDPRNGPAFDLPPPDGPPQIYVVASLPRTGSTLLCRTLWDTGLVGAPSEYLNPMQIRDWEVRFGSPVARLAHLPLGGPLLALVGCGRWTQARRRAHLARVVARRTGAWFGLKIHRHHFERWFPDADPARLLGPHVAPIRWVRLTRRDRVAQAVSWVRALQTGRWAGDRGSLVPPRYSRRAITGALARIARDEAAWDAFFADRGLDPLALTYEELATDLDGAVRAVLRWLEVPAPDRLPDPSLPRQADARTRRWIARFRAGR